MNGMSRDKERVIEYQLAQQGIAIDIAKQPRSFYRHHKGLTGKGSLNFGESDCISCQKNNNGKIPNNPRCQLICKI